MGEYKKVMPFIIGVTGYAGSGKDTLTKYIIDEFSNEFQFEHLSLAEELKRSLSDFCEKNFKISPFTTDREKKSLIRPVLVEVARVNRIITKGSYYTNILSRKINECIWNNKIPIISDIRYIKYEGTDEYYWLRKNNGILLSVDREGVIAPNEDELENYPKLKSLSDLNINWKTTDNIKSEMIKYKNDIYKLISKKAYGR